MPARGSRPALAPRPHSGCSDGSCLYLDGACEPGSGQMLRREQEAFDLMHILNHTFLPSLSNPPDAPIVNIADAFQFQAFYHPTSLAVCVPGSHYGPVGYGRLLAMSNSIGWRCLAASVKAGHVVAILSSDPVFHLATILALKRIGAVSLSIGQALLPDEFAIDVVITDTAQKFAGCE